VFPFRRPSSRNSPICGPLRSEIQLFKFLCLLALLFPVTFPFLDYGCFIPLLILCPAFVSTEGIVIKMSMDRNKSCSWYFGFMPAINVSSNCRDMRHFLFQSVTTIYHRSLCRRRLSSRSSLVSVHPGDITIGLPSIGPIPRAFHQHFLPFLDWEIDLAIHKFSSSSCLASFVLTLTGGLRPVAGDRAKSRRVVDSNGAVVPNAASINKIRTRVLERVQNADADCTYRVCFCHLENNTVSATETAFGEVKIVLMLP